MDKGAPFQQDGRVYALVFPDDLQMLEFMSEYNSSLNKDRKEEERYLELTECMQARSILNALDHMDLRSRALGDRGW